MSLHENFGRTAANTLFFGDNLHVLRDYVRDESVDLIYLDPPFNSNANYNILFKSPQGQDNDAQIEAFEDTWHWNDKAEAAFDEVMRSGNHAAFELLRAMRAFLGENDMMAYLAMMAARLLELHRVLKPTGSLYLHCDPTASHYLKLLLDGVFGAKNYVNEISWKRSSRRSSIKRIFRRAHDIIFLYAKSENYHFKVLFQEHDEKLIAKYNQRDDRGQFQLVPLMASGKRGGETGRPWRGFDPNTRGQSGMHWITVHSKLDAYAEQGLVVFPAKDDGTPRLKYYLDQNDGVPVSDFWDDIDLINSMGSESLGYPTQKPLALLERIIAASSNEGDVVLDPFCGCGTAVHAAQKLGRKWLGIDVTHLAIGLIEKRMKDAFPGVDFTVEGRPQDLSSALDLAERDKHQFELWALSVVDAMPWNGGRKGADGGIDGLIYFRPDGKRTEKAIVEVKGGGIGVKDIGRLAQVMERERALFGVYLTARAPTRAMESDAAAVGLWENEYTGRKHPRLQILTLAELFQGKRPDIPWMDPTALKSARREDMSRQGTLL